MAMYELNGHSWFPGNQEYLLGEKGVEYHRGDAVDVDPEHPFVKQLLDAGSLVDVGFADKLAQEESDAEVAAAERAVEQAEQNDAEAHRITQRQRRLLLGDSDPDESDSGDSGDSGDEATDGKPKPASRRR